MESRVGGEGDESNAPSPLGLKNMCRDCRIAHEIDEYTTVNDKGERVHKPRAKMRDQRVLIREQLRPGTSVMDAEGNDLIAKSKSPADRGIAFYKQLVQGQTHEGITAEQAKLNGTDLSDYIPGHEFSQIC